MKYLIMQVATVKSGSSTATNYTMVAEENNLDSAKINYHNTAAALWNEPSVISATLTILDENLDKVGGYNEFIHHESAGE